MCLSNQCHEYRLFVFFLFLLWLLWSLVLHLWISLRITYFAMTNCTFGCHFEELSLSIKNRFHLISKRASERTKRSIEYFNSRMLFLAVTMVSTVTLNIETRSAANRYRRAQVWQENACVSVFLMELCSSIAKHYNILQPNKVVSIF